MIFIQYSLFIICMLIHGYLCGQFDVVIPCHKKDKITLEWSIKGAKQLPEVRNVYVVSEYKMTTNAQWIPESAYPFTKSDTEAILRNIASVSWSSAHTNRVGWYYQQLLKLYCWQANPDLADYVLIIDSDTIFTKPIYFFDNKGAPLYAYLTEYHKPYFFHGKKLMPNWSRVWDTKSGICHHMLLHKATVQKLKNTVEEVFENKMPFWAVFLQQVDSAQIPYSGASEYELYFNFIFKNNINSPQLRSLSFGVACTENQFYEFLKNSNYDVVTFHSFNRDPSDNRL